MSSLTSALKNEQEEVQEGLVTVRDDFVSSCRGEDLYDQEHTQYPGPVMELKLKIWSEEEDVLVIWQVAMYESTLSTYVIIYLSCRKVFQKFQKLWGHLSLARPQMHSPHYTPSEATAMSYSSTMQTGSRERWFSIALWAWVALGRAHLLIKSISAWKTWPWFTKKPTSIALVLLSPQILCSLIAFDLTRKCKGHLRIWIINHYSRSLQVVMESNWYHSKLTIICVTAIKYLLISGEFSSQIVERDISFVMVWCFL